MRTWRIYKHTNKINGKAYIGQTCKKDPNKRWQDGEGYHGTIFAKAIEKYGWDNFEHEIIEDNIPTKELADERETYWIKYYGTYCGDGSGAGYNTTEDGQGKGYNMTRGGNDTSAFSAPARPIYQIDTKTLQIVKEWESAIEAIDAGFAAAASCANRGEEYKRQKTSGGYYWCFVDEYTKDWKPKDGGAWITDENGDKVYDRGDEKICQIDKDGKLIKIWNNASEAANALEINIGKAIQRICKKETYHLSTAGYYWCYLKDWKNWEKPIIERVCPHCGETFLPHTRQQYLCKKCQKFHRNHQNRGKKFERITKKVRCVENNTVFNTVAEAAVFYHCDKSDLGRCCKGQKKTCGGYHWEFVE